jgi:hypothetical protein
VKADVAACLCVEHFEEGPLPWLASLPCAALLAHSGSAPSSSRCGGGILPPGALHAALQGGTHCLAMLCALTGWKAALWARNRASVHQRWSRCRRAPAGDGVQRGGSPTALHGAGVLRGCPASVAGCPGTLCLLRYDFR